MEKIRVQLKKKINDSYDLFIGKDILESCIDELKKNAYGERYAILTDKNILKKAREFSQKLQENGVKSTIFPVSAGEKSKSLAQVAKVALQLLKASFDRSSALITFGGGVIGDLGGFVASIYMRGIPCIQIPTTLLAMVDASIGGKTAVNLKKTKNILGSFYQPKVVYIDTDFLTTLPEKEWKNGLVELIKHAIIRDAKFFEYIEENAHLISQKNSDTLNKIIIQSCNIKARIIEKDEKEAHIRMLLNYGHTIGHALESLYKYRVHHGLCVAQGIITINRIAVKKKLMEEKDALRIEALFQKIGIDTRMSQKIDTKKLIAALKHDKKFRGKKMNFVIVPKIGTAKITQNISLKDVLLYSEHSEREGEAPVGLCPLEGTTRAPIKQIEIHPTKNLQPFSLKVPSSKSYSNRALIMAALAKGTSTLKNVLLSDDTLITIHALKNLGIPIKQQGKNLLIQGCEGAFKKQKKALHLGNSGTAVRFLTAVLAINGIPSIITGDKRMQSRPIQDLVDTLNQLGGEVQSTHGYPPIKINHKKSLKGGHAKIRGDISSQFLSALLIAIPYAQKKTTISVTTPLTSASYIDTTLDAMHHFGIKIKNESKKGLYQTFSVKPKQKYRACTYAVPADASSASYFLALAALHGTKVTLKNIHFSFQGDFQFLKILKKMGCHYTHSKNTITLKGPKKLKPLKHADLNAMPDAALTVAIVCAFANGRNDQSYLRGLHNLQYKESNRLQALECELKKIGIGAKSTKDGIIINGNHEKMHGASIETYNDHRIAMCFAIMGTKIPKIFIKNPKCVAKTYPNFWKDLQKVRIQLTTHT